MNEFKGTPGPWYWNSDDELFSEKNIEVLVACDDDKPYRTNSATIEHHYDPEIKKANKTLIAAAPELLEALDELANGYAGNGWDVGLVTRLDKARDVIAKALGEKNDY